MSRPLVVLAAALALLFACRPETVRLAYRPAPGTVARYAVRTEATTTLSLPGTPLRRNHRSVELTAVHTVLGRDARGVRVRVDLTASREPARRFIVRLDRAGQLREVVAAAVILPGDLDGLGLSELLRSAAGVPPDRPLRPGDRWRIADTIRLPGSAPVRLTGRGRLVELGTVRGHRVARVQSRTALDVRRTTPSEGLRIELAGRLHTEALTTYDVDDGSIVGARSATAGELRVTLSRPEAGSTPPLVGFLRLTIRSDVRRTR